MGLRGPKPMPTHLKLLRGNPGQRPLSKDEPRPAMSRDIPEPPPFLIGYAKEEWHRVITELYRLKLVTSVDINPLAAYCQAYSRWRTAEERLADLAARDPVSAGLMIKSAGGTPIQNPIVGVANRAAADMLRYASEFGLTPAARTRLSSSGANAPASKFGSLFAS